MPGLRALPGLRASPPALLLLLALALPRGSLAVQQLEPGSRSAAAAARVALQYRNFQAGSLGGLRALGQVRKATLKNIPESGHKYYLQFSTEDYRTGEDAGNCLATVLFPKKKSRPVVSIKCSPTKDQKEIQEEDNKFYQRIRHQSKPITANNIPDSYGNIEPALEPVWALAVAGSSSIMWEKSTETLGYFLAQVKSVRQWMRKDDFVEFDYTVLLHEMPTQEIISCHMRLAWLPRQPLKVKHFCAPEGHGAEQGSGAESGSAAGPSAEKGGSF
ncbi:ovocalyxin-32-like [Melozone crissalis]|uniref:ovocalyxin-32-like n=1 Tax=Melozone crissalis TaxID=40204 RepID=UPI0023DAA928|nr:ovocalyxin-32-like [Melozone crissalis]